MPTPLPQPGTPPSPPAPRLRVAIIGAGWAGMAAAVRAVQAGHAVAVFEAARQPGGRARGMPLALPDGRTLRVDNGQHILIGAYSQCLALMRTVGIDPAQALLRLPLTLRYPDGSGLRLARWPAPLDAAAGILAARGWRWSERWALLRAAWRWQRSGFACDAAASVAELCQGLPPRLLAEFIEPLCVSALNTPMPQASAQVFLRVLHDALLSQHGGSNLLLPRIDLGALLPEAAARFITQAGAQLHLGQRIGTLHWQGGNAQAPRWQVAGQGFDRVILATAAPHAAQIIQAVFAQLAWPAGAKTVANAPPGANSGAEGATEGCAKGSAKTRAPGGSGGAGSGASPAAAQAAPGPAAAPQATASALAAALDRWQAQAASLSHRAITTLYAQADAAPPPGKALLPAPMLALRSSASAPAQFVFDRDAITAPLPPGAQAGQHHPAPPTLLLAFVVSDSAGARGQLQAAIAAQAQSQLGLRITPLLTVTEKRATFACTPGLVRPAMRIAPGLLACGDHVAGPYPATLEGAVRSGAAAADALAQP